MSRAVIVVIALIVVSWVVPSVILGPRVYKDIKKKQAFKNTYAIINVKNGKAIRVRDASIDDGAAIIIYSHQNWECMTWQLVQLDGESFLLKNLYTQKTFQPLATPEAGDGIWQQTLGGSHLQYWELLHQPNETYLIRLKDTEFCLTASGEDNNTPIVLMPKQDKKEQFWKLVRQNPII